jgi:hypothetical protein
LFFYKIFGKLFETEIEQTNINEHKSSRKPLEPKLLQLKRSTSPQNKLHILNLRVSFMCALRNDPRKSISAAYSSGNT